LLKQKDEFFGGFYFGDVVDIALADQRAGHHAGDLDGGRAVTMGVIPECSGWMIFRNSEQILVSANRSVA
jgi:hypothetical protein